MLVIIGLLFGSVLVGQQLIKTSELNSVISDYAKIEASVNTFREKYNCLPGDCINATSFLDTEPSGCPDGSTGRGTCNGNGNGFIEYTDFASNIAVANHENFRFWQHLSLAKMWSGNFTGINGPNGTREAVFTGTSQNSPLSRLSGGNIGWMVYDSSTPWNVYSSVRNTVELGMPAGGNLGNWGGGITPENAKWIDAKIDDGLSFSSRGSIFGGGVGAGGCVTNTASGVYNTAVTTPVCTLILKLHQ